MADVIIDGHVHLFPHFNSADTVKALYGDPRYRAHMVHTFRRVFVNGERLLEEIYDGEEWEEAQVQCRCNLERWECYSLWHCFTQVRLPPGTVRVAVIAYTDGTQADGRQRRTVCRRCFYRSKPHSRFLAS